MLRQAVAVNYFNNVSSGKTLPCRIGAIEEVSGNCIEVVLKCSASCYLGTSDLAREVLGAYLAESLGMRVPNTYIIDICDDFIESIPDALRRDRLDKSCRKAFGSEIVPQAFPLMAGHRQIENEFLPEAAAIWTFDGGCENTDRRVDNPNLLTRGSEWWLIDHEMIWPTVYMFGHKSVWEIGGLDVQVRSNAHIFSSDLKSKNIDFDHIKKRWAAIDLDGFKIFSESLPVEWNCSEVTQAALQQISSVQSNIDKFFEEAKRVLT